MTDGVARPVANRQGAGARCFREVIGIDLGEVDTEAFWVEFLRSLRSHGLGGIRLCVSDQDEG